MFPVYKDMNSYPSQWNQMPSSQYYHPNWEAVPPHMKEDQSNSSCTHQPWPHSYGYPAPMQCHSCCSHGQQPPYYNFRPPCSHIPPPPPPPHTWHHYYGGYPPYPQPYPMYYAPPPHYSMDLPRYEYDKNVPRDQSHCCGCLNHPCHTKGRNNVKIEEHEPDVDATKQSESSFPAAATNKFPYPVLWIPPEYTMNKEQPRRLIENETNKQHDLPNVTKPQVQWIPVSRDSKQNDGSPLDRKPHQGVHSAEQDPNSSYGWIPLDISRIKQLMEGGNAKQTHDQEMRNKDDKAHDVENKGGDKQLSYPIFWMPYDRKANNSSEGQGEKTDGVAAKESPAHNVVPREIEHTDNKVEKQRKAAADDDGRIGGEEVDQKRKVRTIPVKQLEDSTPKVSNKEEENKQDTGKNTTNAQSSSTTKKSKLPPICLRVDPPKKKAAGGSSRSSSPPGDKKRQDSGDSSSERKCQQPHKEIKVKDAEDKLSNQHTVEVSHGAEENDNVSRNLKDQTDGKEKKAEKQADSDRSEKVERADCKVQAQESPAAKQEACQQKSKQDRKVMSETEAAVTIQTVYRGHDVRRSEPIKKLKEITQVHEEAIQLKKHLEDLESRPSIEDKEKAATGEAIMKLLLKLDTIQGLHQSIRDVRRSVAKELIILQEKLDSLLSRKSDTSAFQAVEEPSTDSGLVEGPSKDSGVVEEPCKDSGLVEGSQVIVDAGDPIKDSSLDGDESAKESEGGTFSSSEVSSTRPHPCQDNACGSENNETVEPAAVNIRSQTEPPHDDTMISSTGSEDVEPAGLDSKTGEKSDVSDTVQEPSSKEFQQSLVDMSSIENSENDLGSENKHQEEESDVSNTVQEKSPTEIQQTLVDMSSVENTHHDLGSENQDHEEILLSELPQEVVEESLTNTVPSEDIAVQKDLLTGNRDEEENLLLEQPEKVDEESLANVSIIEDRAALNAGNEDQEADNLFELPREVVEDEKGIQQTEQEPYELASPNEEEPCEDASSACKVERVEQDLEILNLPLEVDNDDGKEIVEVETSRDLKSDQEMDHPSERLEVGIQEEDAVITEHENHEHVELSSEETLIGQEGESNTSPTNIEIAVTDEGGNKVQESAGEEVDKMDEVPLQEEKEVEVTEKGSEMSNAECSARAVSFLHAGDEVNKAKTVELEGSNDDGSSELSFEDQGSVAVGEKEEQTDKKILEENEKLRGMLEKLLTAGKEQEEVISSLNGKVKDLEKKLRKKKVKSAKHPRVRVSRPLCAKPAGGSLGDRPMGIAS